MMRAAVLLALVMALGCAAQRAQAVAKPDFDIYHTKDGVFEAFKRTVSRCPDIMRLDEQQMQGEGGNYTSTLSVVTVEPGGLTGAHDSKLRLLLNFGEHGRELISAEIGLRLLELLCHPGAAVAALVEQGVAPDAAQALLHGTVFKVVPMENVRGRELVEGGALCERKNGRGVDPNRNWDVHWGHKEQDYDPSEEYPGTGPFSEPEAALMRVLAVDFKPHVWLSVHSGMEALFMPYDHKGHIPEGKGAEATLAMLQRLNKRVCKGACAVGSGGKTVGYVAHGTATDYMYDVLNVPISMTWEVYGDSKATYEDCFRIFNPLTPKAYNDTVEKWSGAMFALLAELPKHPLLQPLLAASHTSGSSVSTAAALGRRGGLGGGRDDREAEQARPQQQQQLVEQQQEGQQQEGAGLEAEGGNLHEAGNGTHGDRAEEIAAALHDHLLARQETGAGGEAAGRMLWQQQQHQPPKPNWQLIALLLLAVSGTAAGGYMWQRRPRLRYALSRVFNARRSRRLDIPL